MSNRHSKHQSSKKLKFFQTLEFSFSLFIFISLTILVLSTSLVTHYKLSSQLEDIQHQETIQEVNAFKEHLNTFIHHYQLILEDQSKHPLMIQTVMQPESNKGKVSDFMKTLFIFGRQHQKSLLDFEGKTIHATKEYPKYDYSGYSWVHSMVEGHISHHFELSYIDLQTYLRIASPVKLGGNVEGVLVAEIPFDSLEIFDRIKESLSNSHLVFSNDGNIVKTIGQALPYKSETSFIEDLGLSISLTIDQGPWLEKNNSYMRNQAYLLGTISLLVLFSSIILGRILFIKRITLLDKGAQEFTEGNLDFRIPISGKDEITNLTENFNSLGEKLKSSLDALENEKLNLEAKVLERTKELNNKAEDLIKANRYKSQFLANMSHELRTPLNSILVLSQLLRENNQSHLDHEEVEFAQTIHQSGSSLLTIINDILDLSFIESGRMTLTINSIELSHITETIKIKFESQIKKKDLDFYIEVAEDLPRYIISDHKRIIQVLGYLISNSIKFTSKGCIKLLIQRPRLSYIEANTNLQPESSIDFCISDTGIGIPQHKQDLIFEAFQQGDGSITRHYGGTGLGLTLSKEFCHLLHGQMFLRSQEKLGSEFHFILPERSPDYDYENNIIKKDTLESGTKPCIFADKPASPTHQFNGEKVLIINSNIRNVFTLSSLLEDSQLNTLPASNLEEADEQLEKHKDIRVILIDQENAVHENFDSFYKKIKTKNQLKIILLIETVKPDPTPSFTNALTVEMPIVVDDLLQNLHESIKT